MKLSTPFTATPALTPHRMRQINTLRRQYSQHIVIQQSENLSIIAAQRLLDAIMQQPSEAA